MADQCGRCVISSHGKSHALERMLQTLFLFAIDIIALSISPSPKRFDLSTFGLNRSLWISLLPPTYSTTQMCTQRCIVFRLASSTVSNVLRS